MDVLIYIVQNALFVKRMRKTFDFNHLKIPP